MIFRQLYEPDSSTYTYLVACPDSGDAVLIDPVLDAVTRDLSVVQQLGLNLRVTLDTHVHADHLTGARRLKQLIGSRIAFPAMAELPCTDIGVEEGRPLEIGSVKLHPLFTPGHTSHHHCFVVDNGTMQMVFAGDALLIDACGRTDFQSGNAATLYRSIQEKLYSLPNETLVYPCHDYKHRQVSTIGQEKRRNPYIHQGTTEETFIATMNGLGLPYPRKIGFSVPGNEQCGRCPNNVPEEYAKPCLEQDADYGM
jgi:sulfur dioxygenase